MRPTLLVMLGVVSVLLAGCAYLRSWTGQFADQAASCQYLEQITQLAAMEAPCRYADALAQCFELPEDLRLEIHEECVERRDRLVDDVLPKYAQPQ